MGDATKNFGIYLTLPERWRKKLEEQATSLVVPGKQPKIQDTILTAVAAMFFPEECEVTRRET
jgi:hypothetical protein